MDLSLKMREARAPSALALLIVAAAGVGVGGGSVAWGDGGDWLAELPSAAQASAAFPASTPQEYARRAAAFAVLVDIIEVRSGADQRLVGNAMMAQLPPTAGARWREYVHFGYAKVLTTANGSWQMFTNPAFRADVLGHFLPKASIAAYEDARNRIPGVPGASNVKANWKPLAADGPAANPAVVKALPTPPPVAVPSGPLSVFGAIQIGAPLALPGCGRSLATSVRMSPGVSFESFLGPQETKTCVGPPDEFSAERAAVMLHAETEVPKSVSFRLVNLDSGHCPDWVKESGGCVLSVALHDGAVTSVGFYTGPEEKSVVKALVQKYAAGNPSRSSVSCQTQAASKYGLVTRMGTRYVWKTPRLLVSFWSTGSGLSCDQGSVLLLTHEFQDLLDRGNAHHEESQPKL